MIQEVRHTALVLKLCLLALQLCCTVFYAEAQSLQSDFDSYSKSEGLSQNTITSIVQDKQGFMWFGTEDGLNRFDGHDFKIYRHRDNDSTTIVSSTIRALLVDDNSLWIGTDKGVNKLCLTTEQVQQFTVDYMDVTKLKGTYVSAIKKHPNGSIWISYVGSGINIITPGKQEILHYTIHHTEEGFRLKNDMVSAIQFMPDDYTIVGSYSDLQVIDHRGVVLDKDESLKKYPWQDQIKGGIKTFYLSRNKALLYIGTEVKGLYVVDLKKNTVSNLNRTNSEITSDDILTIQEDSRGYVWVGSDAIYLHKRQQDKLLFYNGGGQIYKNHIPVIFEDRDQNIWMGTLRLGVRKFNYHDTQLQHYHSNQGEGSIKSDEVLSFSEDELGNVWLGAGGAGILKMQKYHKTFEDPVVNKKLVSPVIKSIYKDDEGYFWMGGWDAGLVKYHPIYKTLEQYHPTLNNFESRHIWSIAADRKGNLWIGTLRDGLIRYSKKTKEVKYFKFDADDTTALANNDIMAVHVDARDILWIATSNGLSVLHPGTEKFSSSLKFSTDNKDAIYSSLLQCIYEDPAGRMWFGTKGGGILIVKLKGKKLLVEKIIKKSDGLPSNIVNGIQADEHHNVWVSTSTGLAKINPSILSKPAITPVLNLQGTEFIANSSFKSSDGRLFFGAINGFYAFDPDSLDLTPKKVDVLFTSLKIINDEIIPNVSYRGRIVLENTVSETDQLKLTYKDYAFTIHFAPVVYNKQKIIKYKYQLENLDKEWQYTTAERRFVHYTNLAPGKYVLKVKASYDGINWPEEAKTLQLTVLPPWWETVWFKLIVVLMVASVLYSFYKIRISFFKQQQSKLEDLVMLRTAELKKSNNEIQGLLNEVAEQKQNIESQNEELHEINEELSTQRDALEKAQYKLREINASLELLVDKRTQSLNDTVQELETFLYRASHDLRGPISTMQGLLMISKLEGKDALQEVSYAALINKSVLKLERTLQKLLQKYTIQKDALSMEFFSKSSFNVLLDEVCEDIRSFRVSNFEVSIEDGLLFETDRKLMYIMLLGVLENAFLYSEKSADPRVILDVKQCDQHVLITVTDYGVGIKKELQDKIFNMFFRGNVSSTGNGLGLYLVKCAVEKLNGEVVLESEEGQFTRLSIQLQANTLNLRPQLVLQNKQED